MLGINSKKGSEEITIQKLMQIILILLVIAAVLMFIFKPQVLDWIRNLPGYESQQNKEIAMTPDQLAVSGCLERVAIIGSKEAGAWITRQFHERRTISIFDEGVKEPRVLTNLYADTSEPSNYIIEYAGSAIGDVQNSVLKIKTEVFQSYASGSRYSDLRKDIKLDDLRKLDNSQLRMVLTLCKNPSQTANNQDENQP